MASAAPPVNSNPKAFVQLLSLPGGLNVSAAGQQQPLQLQPGFAASILTSLSSGQGVAQQLSAGGAELQQSPHLSQAQIQQLLMNGPVVLPAGNNWGAAPLDVGNGSNVQTPTVISSVSPQQQGALILSSLSASHGSDPGAASVGTYTGLPYALVQGSSLGEIEAQAALLLSGGKRERQHSPPSQGGRRSRTGHAGHHVNIKDEEGSEDYDDEPASNYPASTSLGAKEKNRQAQRRFRARQKQLIQNLKEQMQQLISKSQKDDRELRALREDNAALRARLEVLTGSMMAAATHTHGSSVNTTVFNGLQQGLQTSNGQSLVQGPAAVLTSESMQQHLLGGVAVTLRQ